ncbi:uncharacterized protein LOC124543853 [Vanessa cardui]|uniref:uncharacterized protein LOC124530942 n=1 Tax=Vanessa cardui TaxID=171605 RepID=UPI001F132700|nr:uncharacterized protein LOC124530942 [Vanessa cardui]XP_046978130.1 uncharacterized protein LOC124543853 [Vanessa cardui]
MENYIQYLVMGSVSQMRMKSGCMPTRFECQLDRRKRTSNTIERPYVLKKQRRILIEESEKDFAEKSTPTKQLDPAIISSESSVLHTSEEHHEGPTTTYPKSVDKSVQVHITHKFRSKAVQTKIKLVSQLTSPLKPYSCSIATSPFKIESYSKPVISSSGVKHVIKNKISIEDHSDSDISYAPSVSQRETSPSIQSLIIKSTSDCSELTEETKKEERLNILKYTLLKIMKNPRSYLGLPKSCCYLLGLIEEQTRIPHNHLLLYINFITQVA